MSSPSRSPLPHGSSLSATQLGLRALLLGALGLAFTAAMLSPAVDGVGDLPAHVLGKIQGDDPPPARIAPPAKPKFTHAQQEFLRRSAVGWAQKELGVKEWNGDNRGARIVTYRRAVSGRFENPNSAEPWCADFVSWAWKKAGFKIGFGGKGSDYVGEIAAWARLTGRWRSSGLKYRPRPGDLIIYARYDHIGMVVRVKGGTIHAVEGNYKDSVSRRKVPLKSSGVIGFVRPV